MRFPANDAETMDQDSDPQFRERCYACFRPLAACFCAAIPRIENRTNVLILQHRREQFHRFNTARIVHQALRNSELLSDHTERLAQRIRLQPRAGLLYPGPTATLISNVPVDLRPQQLVVVDGTWHHTKTLLRDIPLLRTLPRYQLAPSAPSRYRIRREPDALFLSTVEATVAALRMLEPETAGLDQLLLAFETMIDVQLSHPGSASSARFKTRSNPALKHIPLALRGSLEHIVVAYGEAMEGQRGRKRVVGPPISWFAQRLGDGEKFACTLQPPEPLSEAFLGHLELSRDDFADALTLEEARQRWFQFLRPGDLVTMLHPGTVKLYTHLAGEQARCLLLKSIDIRAICGQSPILPVPNAGRLGRASKRLSESIALVRHLNRLIDAANLAG